jgi:hypothetical protein
MVGHEEELSKKTVEEIQQEADEEIARAARLAWDAKKLKRHNSLQDDSGASDDEPSDGDKILEETPPKVQFTMPSRPRSTPKPDTINPRGNRSNRVPGEARLPHSGIERLGLKDAQRSIQSPPTKGQRRS